MPVALEFRGHQQLCRYKQQAQTEQEPEARRKLLQPKLVQQELRELLQLERALVQVLPLWKEQVVLPQTVWLEAEQAPAARWKLLHPKRVQREPRELLQPERALVLVLPLWKEQVMLPQIVWLEAEQARQAFPVLLLLCALQSSPVELFALNLHKAAFLI